MICCVGFSVCLLSIIFLVVNQPFGMVHRFHEQQPRNDAAQTPRKANTTKDISDFLLVSEHLTVPLSHVLVQWSQHLYYYAHSVACKLIKQTPCSPSEKPTMDKLQQNFSLLQEPHFEILCLQYDCT